MKFDWFCCLAAPEQWLVRKTAEAFVHTMFEPIARFQWDSYWSGFAFTGLNRRKAFIAIYGLEETLIFVEGEVPIPAIGTYEPFIWAQIVGFLLTPEAFCLSGCTHVRFD